MSKKHEKKDVASFDLKNFSMKKVRQALEKYETKVKNITKEKCEAVEDICPKNTSLTESLIGKVNVQVETTKNLDVKANSNVIIDTNVDQINNVNICDNTASKHNNNSIESAEETKNRKLIENNINKKAPPADKNKSVYKSNFEQSKQVKFIGSDNENDDIFVGERKACKKERFIDNKNKGKINNERKAYKGCITKTKDNRMIVDLSKKKSYNKKADWCNIKMFDEEPNGISDINEIVYECPICFTDSIQNVRLKCNHLICYQCISRITHILKEKQCPICKCPFEMEIPTTLVRPKCQMCPYIGPSLFDLQNHYKRHGKLLCIECTTNKTQFASEYTLYTTENLGYHLKYGLPNENADNFFGHIYCPFCNKYFYNADVCVKHCRKQHALCTICESMKRRHVYLNDMNDLKKHMKDLHYMCEFKGCECVGFGYNSELVTHLLRTHKIGDGRVNLNIEKRSSIGAFCPYIIEEENKHRIKGFGTKGFVSNAKWEYNKEDENNFGYKEELNNSKQWVKREFAYQAKQRVKESFEMPDKKNMLFGRSAQLKIEAESQNFGFNIEQNRTNQNIKHDILKKDTNYNELIKNTLQAAKQNKSDTKNVMRNDYEKITATNYKNEEKVKEIDMPAYLKRDVIKKETESDKAIKNALVSKYPQFWEEMYKIIDLFLNRQINVETFFERCEFLVGDKENINFMSYITRHFDNDSVKVVNTYLKGYKERVTFPPFEGSEKPKKKQIISKKVSFKIIDLTKKK